MENKNRRRSSTCHRVSSFGMCVCVCEAHKSIYLCVFLRAHTLFTYAYIGRNLHTKMYKLLSRGKDGVAKLRQKVYANEKGKFSVLSFFSVLLFMYVHIMHDVCASSAYT